MQQQQPISSLAPAPQGTAQATTPLSYQSTMQTNTIHQGQVVYIPGCADPNNCAPKAMAPAEKAACPEKQVEKPHCVEKPKCPEKQPCGDKCSQTPDCHHCGHHNTMSVWGGWGWFGMLVLWFIVFVVIFWLIFYSLKPSFVLQSGTNQVDTAKVLLAAVIAALILIIIIWLIRLVVTRCMR